MQEHAVQVKARYKGERPGEICLRGALAFLEMWIYALRSAGDDTYIIKIAAGTRRGDKKRAGR